MSTTSLEQSENTSVQLELGDIIEIIAPRNPQLHEGNFFIDYIDSNKLKLINIKTEEDLLLTLTRNSFEDESIQTVNILSRSDEKGYIKQQGLEKNMWLDIHFDLDVPYILTGEITDIVEDMIEVESIDTKEKLYIDFAYKGVPENLYIKHIEIRDRPKLLKETVPEEMAVGIIEDESEKLLGYTDVEEKTVEVELDEMLLEADQIVFGEVFEDVAYMVDVDVSEKRYDLEEQITDLYDDMLGNIPISKRTYTLENELHRIINRFTELREEFSETVGYNFEIKRIPKNNRPIIENIKEMNDLPFWLIPIANNKKKVMYEGEDDSLPSEVLSYTNDEFIENLKGIDGEFRNNTGTVNRYVDFVNNIHDVLIPFGTEGIEQKIYDVNVGSTISAIVENNESLNSYVYKDDNNITNYTFLQETYLPETFYKKLGGVQNDTYMKEQLTKSDNISIKGLITLPFNYVDYTNIYNKKSSILTKSMINSAPFLLSDILKSENIVSNIVDSKKDSLLVPNKKSKNFFKTLSDHRIVREDDNIDSFDIFLDKVIPKNVDFLSNLLQHKRNIFTVKSLIDNLESFRIYDNTIVAKDADNMTNIITKTIRALKTQIQNRESNMKQISTLKYNTNYIPLQTMKLIEQMGSRTNETIDAYNIPDIKNITDNELINFMIREDQMKLIGDILSNVNLKLYIDTDVKQAVEEYKLKLKEAKERPETKAKDDICKTYVLSKKYSSIEELQSDNGVETYYDMEYDNTPYILKEDYNNEYKTLSEEEFRDFLTKKLTENLGYDNSKSQNIADDIIRGSKIIQNGVYAILDETDENGLINRKYFIRRNDAWEEENIDSEEVFVDNSKTLCNIQPECVSEQNEKTGENNCVSIENSSANKEMSFADQILNDYRTGLMISKEEMGENIKRNYERNYKNIINLRKINKAEGLKYDTYYKKIASSVLNVEIVSSPYQNLLSKILSQTDFTKRQTDIIRFCEQFTYIPSTTEDQFWLYCNKTFVKLIPSFLKTLALAYTQGNYNIVIDRICAERGQLSDDQSSWIDKHSGYIIKNVEYSSDEGYDDTGFKSISRGVLERDMAEDIYEITETTNVVTKEDSNTRMVKNVLKTMVSEIGITLDETKIVMDVISAINRTIPVDEQSKNEKKTHQILLFYCIGYLFILIQTSIPSIRTRKTFPTCVRSFSGYPLEGDADLTGLEYMCCVAIGLKSSIKPWYVLKGKITPKQLVPKIKTIIDKYVLTNTNIRKLIRTKKLYLLKNNESMSEIPDELRVERWNTFLPPLAKITKESIGNVGSTFEDDTTKLIKSGKRHTFKIDALQYKTFRLSLNIQASINEIVAKAPVLMSNTSNSPFIENACCNETGEYNTKKYFTDYDEKITTENNLIKKYGLLRENLVNLSKARILFDNRNTKIILQNNFDIDNNEELRYMAFISYCKYNTGDNIPDLLKPFCQKRPMNYNVNASIFDKIKNLKSNGINYDKGSFMQVLNIINNENSFTINNFDKARYNEREIFETMIEMLIDDPNVEFQVLLQHINNEIAGKNKKGVNNELSSYLMRSNEIMQDEILRVIKYNSTNREIVHVKAFLDSLFERVEEGEVNMMIKKMQDVLKKILTVYPTIILKSLDSKISKESLPKHWKLSDRHYMDIIKIIETQHSELKNCYKDKYIQKLIVNVSKKTEMFDILMNDMPLENNELDFDNNLLLQLYFHLILEAINLYITTTNLPELEKKTISIGDSEERIVDFNEDILEGEEVDLNVLGEEEEMKLKSKLILNFMKLIEVEMKTGNFTYEDVMKKVTKSKIEEKDEITEYLKSMTDEEREIENLFKNNKLERWSVGLQKGLFAYDKDTYDREMTNFDKKIMDAQGNMEMIENIEREREAQEYENREYNMNMVMNDDNPEEGMDGDEQWG